MALPSIAKLLGHRSLNTTQHYARLFDAIASRTSASIELPKRAVFVMTEIDGATTPEIAEALAIPLNTAYSRLRLAREEFAAAVQRIRAQGRLS
jgi:RNA polymerase sigma-70 factor (ECF subfamily)